MEAHSFKSDCRQTLKLLSIICKCPGRTWSTIFKSVSISARYPERGLEALHDIFGYKIGNVGKRGPFG